MRQQKRRRKYVRRLNACCSLVLHELCFTLAKVALQNVLPRFVDLVFVAVVDAIPRYGRHHEEPVFRGAVLIICRKKNNNYELTALQHLCAATSSSRHKH